MHSLNAHIKTHLLIYFSAETKPYGFIYFLPIRSFILSLIFVLGEFAIENTRLEEFDLSLFYLDYPLFIDLLNVNFENLWEF